MFDAFSFLFVKPFSATAIDYFSKCFLALPMSQQELLDAVFLPNPPFQKHFFGEILTRNQTSHTPPDYYIQNNSLTERNALQVHKSPAWETIPLH